uniref:dTDP-glucose 4,6-dehydratase n=1 Tax=Heterorhabditis bacteriophora TaxID=37862 RepID=A0A1I7W766_HETBA
MTTKVILITIIFVSQQKRLMLLIFVEKLLHFFMFRDVTLNISCSFYRLRVIITNKNSFHNTCFIFNSDNTVMILVFWSTIVVVTGGAMGIGCEVAKILAIQEQAKVCILDINEVIVYSYYFLQKYAILVLCSNMNNMYLFSPAFSSILITVKTFLHRMVEAKQGQIVSIGSICSHYGEHYGTAYCIVVIVYLYRCISYSKYRCQVIILKKGKKSNLCSCVAQLYEISIMLVYIFIITTALIILLQYIFKRSRNTYIIAKYLKQNIY